MGEEIGEPDTNWGKVEGKSKTNYGTMFTRHEDKGGDGDGNHQHKQTGSDGEQVRMNNTNPSNRK